MAETGAANAPRILAFAGSARRGSFNRRLLRAAVAAARARGAAVTGLELAALDLPFYDGDLEREHGLPDGARRLKAALRSHDALLVAAPEYNGGYTPLLKNALDWASRAEGDEAPCAAYAGLRAGLVGASPGRGGAARALAAIRVILGNMGVEVVANQFGLARAGRAFDESGALVEPAHRAALDGAVAALCDAVARPRREAG